MIEVNYKSSLVFYDWTEEVKHKQKNDKIRKTSKKMSEVMTQKRYVKEILLIVRRRKEEVKRAED